MEQAEKDAAQAVAKARVEAEQIIADLRKLALEERTSVKEHVLIEAKRRLDEAVPKLNDKNRSTQQAKKPKMLQAGDDVIVSSIGQRGQIVEIVSGSEAVVQLGMMKMKVALADLDTLGGNSSSKKPVQHVVTGVKRTRDEHTRSELDLRGANLDDSIIEVDRFLDESFLANLSQVYIIHGKGTGVLRSGIQDYMRKHRNVKSYRLGNYGEGGNGVTVVELK
jgi:DNA mismatch repair protein MutS2